MDSIERTKIFAALLAAAFVMLGLTFLSDGLYHSDDPEKPGYEIAGAEPDSGAPAAEAKGSQVEDILPLLASADLAAGEKAAKKCVACHNFNEGGANKVGPALYGIVDRQIASVEGFGYSGALKAYAADKVWDYAELNGFLYKPKTHVKGTSMGFAGVKKTNERAALVAYLRSLAATPAPLPPES